MKPHSISSTSNGRNSVIVRVAPPKPRMIDLDQSASASSTLPRIQQRPSPPRQEQPVTQAQPPKQAIPMVYVGNTVSVPSTPRKSTTTPQFTSASASQQQPSGFSRNMMVAGFEDEDTSSSNQMELDYKYTWAQDNYSTTKRTFDTWSFVLLLRARLFLLDQPYSYIGGMTPEKKSLRAKKLAIWVRETILQLGPTFIKLGQLFSTRSDLFQAEFVSELSKLQDRVPAFSADKAIAIIERELGAPIDQLFAEFDPAPIAAASLGQVHRARLFTGEDVVVKVQRPGLRKLFDIDLENLRLVAEQLDKGDEGAGTRDFLGIYNEAARILYEEIDYINEGKNADRFRRNFRDIPWVKTPRVYWQRSRTSVITLDYVPGMKITDSASISAANLDGKLIAKRATESFLIQILQHGFFHADPHPGNIAIDTNGNLIYYDFGMMGAIDPNIRENLLQLFYGIAKKDTDQVLKTMITLGIIAPTTTDTLSIRRALTYFLDNINKQAEQKVAVAAIGEDLFAIAIDSPFRFPANFTFVLRSFATLEGIGKALDPDFSFAVTATPYAQELLSLQPENARGLLFEQFTTQATEVGQAAAAMPLRVARIEKTISQLETGDLKLRVRNLEGERSARRGSVLQMVQLQAIACMGLLNLGFEVFRSGYSTAGGGVLAVGGVFGVLVVLGLRRVKRLDKFEDGIKGKGGNFPSS